jgi:hypothetical protein
VNLAGKSIHLANWQSSGAEKLTSGSGHSGSESFSTSPGFITSILTSCATRTLRPTRVKPDISKLSKAWSFFFANLMTTSSVSKDEVGEDDEADFKAASKASEGRTIVISLFALDWMR